MRGRIFNFQRYSIHDGPGIRSLVFLSSCPLRCLWCCNPESFISDEPPNQEVKAEEVMGWILEDRAYFKNSGGGVTFSGGEPLLQIEFTKLLLQKCRKEGIGTAVDTCGDVPWDNFEIVSGLVDYYLYDIKHLDEEVHKRYTGAGNKRILDNLRKLSQRQEKIFLRVPLIPEYNMDEEEAFQIGQLAREIKPQEVHLLPYHRLGEKKYSKLKFAYALTGKKDLMSYNEGKRAVNDFASIIRSYTQNVCIGG